MAKSTEPAVQGWPGFLAELLRSFLFLRDIFGYALPGAVFLSIGVLSGRVCLQDLKKGYVPYQLPTWAWTVLVVAACYVVGKILAAIAYLPPNLLQFVVHFKTERWEGQTGWRLWLYRWLEDHPTEVTACLLKIRQEHPNLFIELDRRETGSVFIGSTMGAFLAGLVVFYWTSPSLCTVVIWAGLLLFIQFVTVIPQLRRVRQAIRHASEAAKPPAPPGDLNNALVGLLNAASEALKNE